MHLPVIFEDDHLLVINKPSGVVVHPFDFSDEETVLNMLHENYPQMFSITNNITLQDGRTIALGGIVHKLDRETSGVLIIAKDQATFDDLRAQFTAGTIEKTYLAHVEGIVEQDSFRIDAPLGRSKKDYKQSTSPTNPRGPLREAVTDVVVLKRNATTTLVILSPRTGRTHQLRAHMASIGHPIVGDIAYGSATRDSRIMLHAQSISYTTRGARNMHTAPSPEEFQ
jgi:23S rRNA pseudouridine1911/1915/1917 synthase